MIAVEMLVSRLSSAGLDRPLPEGDLSVLVNSVTSDSRAVQPGALFCAIQGVANDGHNYIAASREAGAVAALVTKYVDDPLPQLLCDDSRVWTGLLAAALEGLPSLELQVVGVTGTNGKTSIVSLVEHIAKQCGLSSASMGTLTGSLTTAAGPDFQRQLREFRDDGREVVAAEVSSHALDQERVAGTTFAVAVFSNLSQDHLDYHPTMEEYFAAKAKLFEAGQCRAAVIDVSETWGQRLAAQVEVPTVDIDTETIASAAVLGPAGSTFEWRGYEVALPLGGRFGVTNAVLAAEACLLLGCDTGAVANALGSAPQIPGRFELIDSGQPFVVLVDYSHTPASVTAVLESARDLTASNVLIVFGAAGDRDPGKRPLMGEAASAADRLFITSDNPRTEDPEQIISEVLAGVSNTHRDNATVETVTDRAAAIRLAIAEACDGDVVVIAGKGHEDYQIIGSERRDFDDRVEARAALAANGWELNT